MRIFFFNVRFYSAVIPDKIIWDGYSINISIVWNPHKKFKSDSTLFVFLIRPHSITVYSSQRDMANVWNPHAQYFFTNTFRKFPWRKSRIFTLWAIKVKYRKWNSKPTCTLSKFDAHTHYVYSNLFYTARRNPIRLYSSVEGITNQWNPHAHRFFVNRVFFLV